MHARRTLRVARGMLVLCAILGFGVPMAGTAQDVQVVDEAEQMESVPDVLEAGEPFRDMGALPRLQQLSVPPVLFTAPHYAIRSVVKNNFGMSAGVCPLPQQVSLLQAKEWGARVILLEGGASCQAFCKEHGIERYEYRLNKVLFYKKWIRRRQSKAVIQAEIVVITFVRYFMLRDFVASTGLRRWIFLDSDTLMLAPPEEALGGRLHESSIASCFDFPVGNNVYSVFTREGLEDFINFMNSGFQAGLEWNTDMHTLQSYRDYFRSDYDMQCWHFPYKRRGLVNKLRATCVKGKIQIGRRYKNADDVQADDDFKHLVAKRRRMFPVRPPHRPKFHMGNLCDVHNGTWIDMAIAQDLEQRFAHVKNDKEVVYRGHHQWKRVTWSRNCWPYMTRDQEVVKLAGVHFMGGYAKKRIAGYFLRKPAAANCTRCQCYSTGCQECGHHKTLCEVCRSDICREACA